ncbi:uncharacterized protein NPIL_671971 [Nephila pilipes]|uniref:Uncharacterized protein n=1 Tax=Nephila pilipes TaxID=299642 RepID=A0A8X6TQ10_NEPPI|nr:uncharacterized protein NPIL_671971 [Nephila pilipes]
MCCYRCIIAGEKLYHMLLSKIIKFKQKNIYLTLADGTQNYVAALTTVVKLAVESKGVPTELIVFPEAEENRTLLGTDFFLSAEIVLNDLNGTKLSVKIIKSSILSTNCLQRLKIHIEEKNRRISNSV